VLFSPSNPFDLSLQLLAYRPSNCFIAAFTVAFIADYQKPACRHLCLSSRRPPSPSPRASFQLRAPSPSHSSSILILSAESSSAFELTRTYLRSARTTENVFEVERDIA